VAEFYAKLLNMWNELANYVKLSKCSCRKCTCDIVGQVAKLTDEEKTHQFLMGLSDEKYSPIHGQILAMEPLPTLERIFNIVRREEQHKQIVMRREHKADMDAFAVNSRQGRRGVTMNEKPICTHCGKIGA